ncbi:MAG: serine/threonine protein kinase [Bryobacterales bacterium]|nr:serine/threonine protein kinase [Bryobacterales bacterium]
MAIKALLPKTHQGWVRDRFATEVATLQSISHPNIVPIADWWVDREGTPFLVMPLLNGMPLRALLDAGPLQPPQLATLLRQLASALQQIHTRGIIHRDIKPENILVVPGAAGEQAVPIDFGSAGLDGGQQGTTTNFGVTYHYMAPERLMGRYGPAGDLYALAVVALECLSGYRAIELRTLPSDPEFRAVLIDALQPALGTRAADVAATLQPCFESNPNSRAASVTQWAAEIGALLDRSPA